MDCIECINTYVLLMLQILLDKLVHDGKEYIKGQRKQVEGGEKCQGRVCSYNQEVEVGQKVEENLYVRHGRTNACM